MALGINTNVASINAQNQLSKSQSQNDQALERLSSGLRINSAKDDAAGLAISSRFEAQINGLNQASRNANDGISLAQTAEGALEEITNITQRVRELAVQSANDTNSASDRQALNEEVRALTEEADRIAQTTQFNGQDVLNGSLSELSFQVGANEGQTIEVSGVDASSNSLGRTSLESDTDFGSAVNLDLAGMANSDDFELNGQTFEFQGSADTDQGQFSNVAELKEAINKADFGDTQRVSASQADETVANLGDFSESASGAEIDINGVNISLNDGSSNFSTQGAVDAINDKSLSTGVTAEVGENGDDIVLTQGGGNDFTVSTAAAGDFATDYSTESTFEAGLELSTQGGDPDAISLTDGTNAPLASDTLGLDDANTESNTLREVDVSSGETAQQAITTIDGVLDQVNGIRSELGAVQNRFESTINNLNTTSENLQASNSRIQDADFSAESAKLAQSQVLQQAGISVLSQANQRPQQVLSLLQ